MGRYGNPMPGRWLAAAVFWLALGACGFSQTEPRPAPFIPPPPRTASAGEPVDFSSVFRLASTTNLDIAQARAVVDQARAARDRAVVQWLPNLAIGTSYLSHEGRTQQSNGNILNVNRDSLFVGGGPTLSVALSDALYGPLVARQVVNATEGGLQRVTNDTLLGVGEAYLQLLRARRRLVRIDDTLELLTAEKPSDLRGKSKGLLPLLRDTVEAGGKEGLRSDLERVRVEVFRRKDERAAAVQEFRSASAELCRLVRMDPVVGVSPVEDIRGPIALPGDEWAAQELEPLVALALGSRPELAEQQALVQAALARLQLARARPYLPTLGIDLAYGGFGGGPIRDPSRKFNDPFNGPIDQPVTPSGVIDRFGPRTDFNLTLAWRLTNMGFGNRAEVREQQAVRDQAQLRLLQVSDRVVAQVVQAYEAVAQSRERVQVTLAALFNEKGEPVGPAFRSVQLNFERIRGAEGRPFEVLDSIRGFNDILDAYGQAVTDYERARLRLLMALGLPAQAYLDPASMPPAPRGR